MTNVDEIKHTAKGVVIGQIDRRSTELGKVVGGRVNNLRDMSSSLRGQGQGATARLLDMAADRLNAVSLYLIQTDGDRIVHDVETVARRRPLITAAVGFVAGIAAARLLKTGAADRYRTYSPEIDHGTR